jgi:hypothetical protein
MMCSHYYLKAQFVNVESEILVLLLHFAPATCLSYENKCIT